MREKIEKKYIAVGRWDYSAFGKTTTALDDWAWDYMKTQRRIVEDAC